MTKIHNTKRVLVFENSNFGFVPPFGDSRKYIQIKDLSIYGIVFRYSNFEFETLKELCLKKY